MQENPFYGLAFWLAVVGAIFDWRYQRKRGVRPTRSHKRNVGIAAGLVLSLLILLALAGVRAEVIGETTAFFGVVLFVLWEMRRFLIRLANPLSRQTPPSKDADA